MPEYITPGVYIEELPSQLRRIEAVDTSIAAFVGRARRGPVNQPTTIQSYGEFLQSFGSFWNESQLAYAVYDFFENGGSRAIVSRLENSATSAIFNLASSRPGESLAFEATNPGLWANQLRLNISHTSRDANLFQLEVIDLSTKETEDYRELSISPKNKNFVGEILKEKSTLLRLREQKGSWLIPTERPSEGKNLAPTPNTASDGEPIQENDFIGANHQSKQTGLYALEKAEQFNLLCIPPYKPDLSIDLSLISTAAEFCERKRAFFIVDPPVEWTSTSEAIDHIDLLQCESPNAAVFYPRLQKIDPENPKQTREAAPSASIAGIIARTDKARGVWKAPAGIEANINGAAGLNEAISAADQRQLNPLAINCIRKFKGRGILVWGTRTLQGRDLYGSEWKYIPTRRLALHIEASIDRSTPKRRTALASHSRNCRQFSRNVVPHRRLSRQLLPRSLFRTLRSHYHYSIEYR